MGTVKYHQSADGNWRQCTAVVKCRLGGEHLDGRDLGAREAAVLARDFRILGRNEFYGELDRESAVIEEARSDLDYYEYYADHAEFIKEAGGQDAYDAEYARRAALFLNLNSRTSTHAG